MLVIGFSQVPFVMLKKFPFVSSFVKKESQILLYRITTDLQHKFIILWFCRLEICHESYRLKSKFGQDCIPFQRLQCFLAFSSFQRPPRFFDSWPLCPSLKPVILHLSGRRSIAEIHKGDKQSQNRSCQMKVNCNGKTADFY